MSTRRSNVVLCLLVAAAAIETAFGLVRRGQDAVEFVRGDRSWEAVSGLIALGWLPVMVAVLWLAVSQLGRSRRRSVQDAESIAAAGATSHEWQWEANADLVITYSNERVWQLLGYRAEEVVGRRTNALLADPADPQVQSMLASGVRTGSGWHDVEKIWRHADGRLVVLQGSATALRDARGRVVGLRGARRLAGSTAADRAHSDSRRRVQAILDDGALQVALQPIGHLGTGEVAGYEALARFADESPDLVFARAETVGLGLDLELVAVRAALPLLDILPSGTYLSINASPDLVLDGRLVDLLGRAGVRLERLVLEITERTQISRYEELHALLGPLRDRGLRLAVDDTGAGYASFHHVLRLRPDVIKLDRSLISDIDSDPAQRSLVMAVALLALDLGATLTAEGIETAAQLRALADLGIDHGQGYHLGRPTLDVAALLADRPDGGRIGALPVDGRPER